MAALNIVLLRASSLLLCMALVCVSAAPEPGATGGEIYPIDSKAFRQVNDYLVDKGSFDDLGAYAKIIDAYSKSDELAQEQDRGVKELVNLLNGIETSDRLMCGEANLAHLKTVLGRVKDAAPGIEKGNNNIYALHLIRVLSNYVGKIYLHCFKPAEKKFSILEQHSILDTEFQWFDTLNQEDVEPEYSNPKFIDMNMLYGAAKLTTLDAVAAGHFVYDLLVHINYQKSTRSSIAGHPKTGEAVHPSYKLAEDHLNKDIIEPCRKLLDMESTQTILVPISHIAMIINLKHEDVRKHSTVFRWTARTINCKWILGMNQEELIKNIISAEPIDIKVKQAEYKSFFEQLGGHAKKFLADLIGESSN